MELSQFFSPLNPLNLLIFIVTMFFFDTTGFFFSKMLDFPKFLRAVYWIFGLGIFIFVWFMLHFFLPFKNVYIWITMAILALPTLPTYIKSGGPITLFKEFILFPFPLLFILFIAKPIFYVLSLPPFIWDEAAYHFYSPARLITETSWQFTIPLNPRALSFYDMIPRLLDTAFVLIFSVSKTYATARLLHFFLYFSSIFAIGRFLQQKVGFLASLIYSFFALFLVGNLLLGATSGYIDSGAAVLVLLFLITMVGYIVDKKKGYLYAAATIFGIAIGIKYTTLVFLVPITFVFFIIIITLNRKWLIEKFFPKPWRLIINTRWFLLLIIIPLTFGGYWYIKNYLISGNPIYPFIFPCKNDFTCSQSSDFFLGWAKNLDFEIFKSTVFQNSELLYKTTLSALIATILLSPLIKNVYPRTLSIMISIGVFFEFVIVRNYLGFLPRYFGHWQLMVPLALSLPFSFTRSNKTGSVLSMLTALTFIYLVYQSAWGFATGFIDKAREVDYIDAETRSYSRNRISLDRWLILNFPKTHDLIKWCGEKGEMKTLLVADPYFIWTSHEGLMRAFLVNCHLTYLALPNDLNIGNFTHDIEANFNNSYLVSLVPCENGLQIKFNDPQAQTNYYLNQNLVCGNKLASPEKTNSILYRITKK
jgi:hypothetical protein